MSAEKPSIERRYAVSYAYGDIRVNAFVDARDDDDGFGVRVFRKCGDDDEFYYDKGGVDEDFHLHIEEAKALAKILTDIVAQIEGK